MEMGDGVSRDRVIFGPFILAAELKSIVCHYPEHLPEALHSSLFTPFPMFVAN